MKFEPGRFLATPAVLDAVPRGTIFAAIERHLNGDWGDVCDSDKRANDRALKNGSRLLSVYHTPALGDKKKEIKFWIITEADRSATTVLLPSDY